MTHRPTLPDCSLLLLSGGRGQRMGGADKGLLAFRGRPLIDALVAVARPLTDDLIISCNRNHPRYLSRADQLVSDEVQDFSGPLAGIRAGMAAMRHPMLLVLPCDAPLVDCDLLLQMHSLALQHPGRPLMLRRGQQWEPLFCIIPHSLAGELEQAWQAGERSPRRFMLAHDAIALDCAEDDPRLANLNTPELLAAAATQPCESHRSNPVLTHLDQQGRASMVDVTDKAATFREACAEARVRMLPATLALIASGGHPKGDVFAVARIAGIMAAKKTHELIPLCHPLLLTGVKVELNAEGDDCVHITARCKLSGQTGVEMEALTAASVAALTLYDMCKAVDRGMTIEGVRLLEKSGGKSGDYRREDEA